jgi:rSAM/selenodomain-associated transferase 2
MRLAIVIPVLDEASVIAVSLQALQEMRARGVRVIVVDGGSRDDTCVQAQSLVDDVITAPRGRARQMNAGAAHVGDAADVLLFLHADTRLPEEADRLVAAVIARGARWGRFDVRISGQSRWLGVVAFLMNWRSQWSGICTGDQALFAERALFETLGGYGDLPLMEDIDFSRRARSIAWPGALQPAAITSGRRWEQRGVWRTVLKMWSLRWRYYRGVDPAILARDYREVR